MGQINRPRQTTGPWPFCSAWTTARGFFWGAASLAVLALLIAAAVSAEPASAGTQELGSLAAAVKPVSASSAATPAKPLPSGAAAAPGASVGEQERTLSFFNTHNFEHLTVVYRRGDEYVPEALAQIKHILRDPFNGEEHAPDPKLLDFLWDLLDKLDCHYQVYIVCGYRCVETNTALHKLSKQVVMNSQHIQGKALDLRVPGCDTYKLYTTAKAMKRGGTGYYKQSDFIHIDTGPVRYW